MGLGSLRLTIDFTPPESCLGSLEAFAFGKDFFNAGEDIANG
jgi:hypothetical protein